MHLHKIPSDNKGVALLTALFAVIIISYLSVEISYESGIEYRLAKNKIDEIKATYAAKSGAELSLLRVAIYKQVSAQFGDQIPDPKLLDLVWTFPLAWPPVVDEDASMATKEEISSIQEDTMQDAMWSTQISSESTKFDINDLNSPVESLQKAIREKLTTLIENKLNQEDAWAERNRDLKVDEIVNNIIDWIDSDSESLNGGDEGREYQNIIPEDSDLTLPPNRDFKTLEELHMVAGITDDIYDVIAPVVTIYGAKGVNVNYAEKDLLRAIDPQITDEIANEIISRRKNPDTGPFKNLEDFEAFISGLGVNIQTYNENKLPLRFQKEFNFKISSIGSFGNQTKEITAIVYDVTNAKAEITKLLEDQLKGKEGEDDPPEDDPEKPPTRGSAPPKPDDKKNSYDKGRPTILYWKES
ncbi:MAG: general secretion pathway protein GspK [Bdellovibrionales bacterium]|nr:general secretion pathway protein GspK [Bdellovibrionales bacterium]